MEEEFPSSCLGVLKRFTGAHRQSCKEVSFIILACVITQGLYFAWYVRDRNVFMINDW